MKVTLPWRTVRHRGDDPIPKAYKPWILLCLAILLGSLLLLAITVTAAFIEFNQQTTPLWVIVLGVLAILGVAVGFGGFFLLMATAGYTAWRADRRVQVLPPRTSE